MTGSEQGNSRSAAQRESEAAIGRVEQQGGPFVTAVEATRMPMVITDPELADNPIVYANAAFLQMSGYAREEVLGRSYHFLSGPDTDPEVAPRIDAALEARRDIVLEAEFYRKGGEPFWVMQFVTPVIDQGGRITQYFASFLDITDRKTLEAELRIAQDDLERRIRIRTSQLEEANLRLEEENDRRCTVEEALRAALAEKEALLREKDVLIREVNRRVKNTLQQAQALLSAQIAYAPDERVKGALASASELLARMAEVHGLFHQTGG